MKITYLKTLKSYLFILLILSLIIYNNASYAQSGYPKYEFRGAWIASVANLDWPSSPTLSVASQQSALITLLDDLQDCGINAVVFQIRPECDALYQSNIEPWSYWLTGQQGKAPNPFYDPLEFAIKEAHKRGMELHAWFNPYRAVKSVGAYSIASNHVSVEHPEWILTVGTLKILNPGLQEVRDYVTSVIQDVVERYDIDAVHFDDYFYPYEGIGTLDAATYASYPRGISNIDDWRRDNVNLFVAQIDSLLKSTKPWVKFGISPFGIWKSGTPAGVTGLSSYSAIYCDPIAWLKAGIVDYIAPQCYWRIGGNQDYGKLAPWWAQQADSYNRHLYVGEIYKSDYSNSELPNQIRVNRSTTGIQGNIIFRAAFISNNTFGFADSMRNTLFKYPAITPQMAWRDSVVPESPVNPQYLQLTETETGLQWKPPLRATDGDSARKYIIYRFAKENVQNSDLDDPANIFAQTYLNQFIPSVPEQKGPYYFVVTALDDNSNESEIGSLVKVDPSEVPQPVLPENFAVNQRDTVLLTWQAKSIDATYTVIISDDSTFNIGTLSYSDLIDTSLSITGLEGMTQYYWRLKAGNAGGWSNFSENFNFRTGFPKTPVQLSPAHSSTGLRDSVTLIWNRAEQANQYHLQLANNSNFSAASMVVDTCGLSDTTFFVSGLKPNKYHFWRISALNEFGTSKWPNSFRFKTAAEAELDNLASIPLSYHLGQNYPNPFNSTTTIKFDLCQASKVLLKIYDLSGNIVKTLVNERMEAGSYDIIFDTEELPSGFYLYQIQTEKFIQTKKMILLK
jgi:uncharacterized lipoprotein YddW (UPF0748 family)